MVPVMFQLRERAMQQSDRVQITDRLEVPVYHICSPAAFQVGGRNNNLFCNPTSLVFIWATERKVNFLTGKISEFCISLFIVCVKANQTSVWQTICGIPKRNPFHIYIHLKWKGKKRKEKGKERMGDW